jgi:branched-subunit amino acid transport protein
LGCWFSNIHWYSPNDIASSFGMNMSWSLVIWLSIGAYVFKMVGFVIVGSRKLPQVLAQCLMLIPAALLAALVFNSTFTSGQSLALDERAVGLGVAIIAAWRKLPLIVVVILGATTTALLRAFS